MLSTNDSSAISGIVLTTDRRRVWLLHLVARWILSCLPGAACCFSPSLAHLGWDYTADLVPRARWWRDEAARGIGELEAALGD